METKIVSIINEMAEYTDVAITFNYTHTFETLESNTQLFHIHGCVDENIILGINPDSNDEGDSIDTAFISFKKYYQRLLYDTDGSYLRWLRSLRKDKKDNIRLLVMGHSLDVTDSDIICDLFEISSVITILYHSKEAKAQYIRNLVTIFGKEHFMQLRNNQNLEFMSLNASPSEFLNDQSAERFQEALWNAVPSPDIV